MRLALLRHDLAVAVAVLRGVANRTGDLLIILVILPIVVLFARARVGELPVGHKELLASGASFLIASASTKALLERVRFHQTDGALAHHAQRSAEWLSFVLPLLVAGVLGLLAALMVIGIVQPLGLALGICAGAAFGLAVPIARELVRPWWHRVTARRRFDLFRNQHSLLIGAGIAATIGLFCTLLPEEKQFDAIFAAGYGLAVILLTARVDAGAVHYMTMVGRSSTFILRKWLPIQIALLLPVAVALAISQNWLAAAVAALIALGLPTLTAMRILAYRSFSRIIADWVTTLLIAAVAFATLMLPPLGLIVIVGAMAWLSRRSKGVGWLIV